MASNRRRSCNKRSASLGRAFFSWCHLSAACGAMADAASLQPMKGGALLIRLVTATGKMNKSKTKKTSSQELFSIHIYAVEIDYLLALDPLTVRRAAEGDAHCLLPVGRARLRVALAPPSPVRRQPRCAADDLGRSAPAGSRLACSNADSRTPAQVAAVFVRRAPDRCSSLGHGNGRYAFFLCFNLIASTLIAR